jgi:hypothetical protein
MNRLFTYWEFKKPSQALYLLLGLLVLVFSCFKLGTYITSLFELNSNNQLILTAALSIFLFYLKIKFILLIFKPLEQRWQVDHKWELIVIFLVFAMTGTSSVTIGRPILNALGMTLENFSPRLYYPTFIISSFILYQILLVSFGWLFGQYTFFWNMEKKLLKRLGITI